MAKKKTKAPRRSPLPRLPARKADSHKGDFGKLLVIGGSRGMIGAPALVANAALRSGAGLVVVACPGSIQPHVAALSPCATSIPLPEDGSGQIAPLATRERFNSMGFFNPDTAPTCIAIGPGLGRGDDSFNKDFISLLGACTSESKTPLVIDADALNAMTSTPLDAMPPSDERFSSAVLTPHPGEMAHLLSTSTKAIQANRQDTARELARRTGSIVVLKGAGTIVTDGERLFINKTGNPGMATGGSGDVLTGIIAALICQGLDRFEAAVLAVAVHGHSGDLAAQKLGQASLIATDLIDYLPLAFKKIRSP